MSLEFLGAKVFWDEINEAGEIWVLRGAHKNIYALEIDRAGFSLPVWSNAARAAAYVTNARPIGQPFTPEAISLSVFTQAWLSDQRMAIAELHINPDGRSSRVLVLTSEEFLIDRGAITPPD